MIGACCSDRCDENGPELPRLVEQPVQLPQSRRGGNDVRVADYDQPVFRFVSFLDGDAELGDELRARATATRGVVLADSAVPDPVNCFASTCDDGSVDIARAKMTTRVANRVNRAASSLALDDTHER